MSSYVVFYVNKNPINIQKNIDCGFLRIRYHTKRTITTAIKS